MYSIGQYPWARVDQVNGDYSGNDKLVTCPMALSGRKLMLRTKKKKRARTDQNVPKLKKNLKKNGPKQTITNPN